MSQASETMRVAFYKIVVWGGSPFLFLSLQDAFCCTNFLHNRKNKIQIFHFLKKRDYFSYNPLAQEESFCYAQS